MALDLFFPTSPNKFCHSPAGRADANSLTSPKCEVAQVHCLPAQDLLCAQHTGGILLSPLTCSLRIACHHVPTTREIKMSKHNCSSMSFIS
jgi:hypothetical protein